MKQVNLLKYGVLWLSLILLNACSQNDIPGVNQPVLQEGEISLQWIPAKMGVYKSTPNGTTRATDIKEQAEQQINRVHIFLFDRDGEYLQPTSGAVFQGYKYMNSNDNWVLQSQLFAEQGMTGAQNATIYVVANVPETYFGSIINGMPEKVPDMTALEDMSYQPEQFSIQIPADGLPMVVKETGVDLSTSATNKLVALQLRSMMARIDISLRMQPDDPCEDRLHPSFSTESITLYNLPVSGTFKPQIENTDNVTTPTTGELISDYKVTESGLLNMEINESNGTVEGSFYMFEHARLAKDYTYPDNISDTDKQRYKPQRANEGAVNIQLKGTYTNHNYHDYLVTYTLYLGGNPVDDFTIGTNRQYKNKVTIKGITVNDVTTDAEALLDTRVNIDREGNPYFIEMLRERKHDAHFNITPMDVYLDPGTTLTISIRPFNEGDAIPGWVRMEPYIQAQSNVCDLNGEPSGSTFPTAAGKGKRYYFTNNLLTELDNTSYGKEYTATHEKERIYFYIDENLEPNERKAKIHLLYTDTDGNTSERDIEIRQARLFKVYIDKFDNGKYIYLEQYEEYLDHYDPLNTYRDTFPGYIWGQSGRIRGIPNQNASYMQRGDQCTEAIIEEFSQQQMTLNENPRSAAEYCYNKNKRNDNGYVNNMQWYMPAIAELEYYLEKYYADFPEFQENFYWSSSPNYYGDRDDRDYSGARSTMISLQNGTFSHVTSDAGQEGYKERTERLRVRAARKSWGMDSTFPDGNE